MKPMKHLLLAVLIGTTLCRAQSQAPLPDMTKTDITALSDFDGARVAFRGFHLGLGRQAAITKLNAMKDLTWDFDAFNTPSQSPASTTEMRIYVHLKNTAGVKDPAVLYLIWDAGQKGISSIVFYKAAEPMLAGNTGRLFTTDALDKACTCRQFLNGEAEETKDNIGITLYRYKAQHFELISMPDEGGRMVWFKLIR